MIKLDLGLSSDALAERLKYLNASEAPKIVRGEWYPLWTEKTGQEPPEDLSGNFSVAMGGWTEPLNLSWYERVTGTELSHLGRIVFCQRFPILRATLDAMDGDTVIEAKHVSGREPLDTVVQRYIPQVQHQMLCANTNKAVLSIIQGTKAPELVPIELDEFWAYQYVDQCKQFWQHVVDGTPPTQGAPLPVPEYVKPTKKVDMTGNNEWGNYAAQWIASRSASLLFNDAARELKAMVASDVGEASGFGIRARRDKRGAITIKEI